MNDHDATGFFRQWLDHTSLDFQRASTRQLDWGQCPPPFKTYPKAPRLPLPRPVEARTEQADLWQAMAGRRSRRDFGVSTLSQRELADLLWACQGVTLRTDPYLLRTAPSAGALYPFETYVSLQNVSGLEQGLTHFHVPSFSLEILEPGKLGPYLANAALGQSFLAKAAIVFVWTAVLPRCSWKYGARAVRYIGLDLGHVCQNLALACEALQLNCCPVAAFCDHEINNLLNVDGESEFAYYLAAVGPRPG